MSKQTNISRKNQKSPDRDPILDLDHSITAPSKISSGTDDLKVNVATTSESQIGYLRHELQETRDKFVILYDYSPNGYATLDSNLIISEANLTLGEWLEVDKDNLKGSDFKQYVAKAFQELFESHLKLVFSGSQKQKCSISLKGKNGRFWPVKVESMAVRDSKGRLSQCYCTFCDNSQITGQQELQHIQKTFLDVSRQAILATDKNLIFTIWNKTAQALFGWTEEEILGNSNPKRASSKFLESLITNEIMQALRDKGEWTGIVTSQTKNGASVSGSIAVGIIWDDSGSFNGLMAIFSSLDSPQISASPVTSSESLEHLVKVRTEESTRTVQILQHELNLQKQATLAAWESEGKNRDLVDNIKLGIFRCTPGSQGRFLEVNQAMEEISGFSREELMQIYLLSIYSSTDDRAPFNNEINVSDWKVTRELLLKKKDGNLRNVAVTFVAIRYDSGTTLYCDGIMEDITERKLAQLQIQHSLARLQKTIKEIIEAMANIGGDRDPYTVFHQRGVARLSLNIGKSMGLSDEQVEGLTMAAFVHDIGKIQVPLEILSKPGRLTNLEVEMLRAHSQKGYEILKTIEFPWPIANIVLQHHERINGSGYPAGLVGDQIVIEARILAVADVIDSMTKLRPYRAPLSVEKVLDEILKNRGTLYDSSVVDNCVKLIVEDHYDLNSPVLS